MVVFMKECFKCKQAKELTEFYRHKMMADGHLNKCKECTKLDALLHREKNIDNVREYDRRRAKLDKRKANCSEQSRKWRRKDPRRQSAHNKVQRAIANGKLTRLPCTVCGSDKSHAHHDDYSKPLDVIFLCAVHHKARHKQLDGLL